MAAVSSELLQVAGRLSTELPWLTVSKYFIKVDSTQNRVLQFLPKEGEGAALIIAESQSKGLGRQGRPWVSPPGGVWFTLALPLKTMTLAQVAPFSIVAALRVADSLKEVNNLECDIKWPNDILYQGKKVGGILLTTTAKFKKGWLLVGVGINVNNEIPSDLSKIATSIKQIRNQSQGRSRLIVSVLSNIWTAWQDFDRTGFGPYQKAVEARMIGVDKSVQIQVGKKTLSGTMTGVDPQGNLLLKSGANTTAVPAGEMIGQPA